MFIIREYPYSFKLRGEMWELHEHLIRRVLETGQENKLVLTGKVIGISSSEEIDEMAIAVKYEYDSNIYIISKKYGWLGPFNDVKNIDFDAQMKIALVEAEKDGVYGKYPLKS